MAENKIIDKILSDSSERADKIISDAEIKAKSIVDSARIETETYSATTLKKL